MEPFEGEEEKKSFIERISGKVDELKDRVRKSVKVQFRLVGALPARKRPDRER